MGTPKVMKLINPNTGHMRCKVCGTEHWAISNLTVEASTIAEVGNVSMSANLNQRKNNFFDSITGSAIIKGETMMAVKIREKPKGELSWA